MNVRTDKTGIFFVAAVIAAVLITYSFTGASGGTAAGMIAFAGIAVMSGIAAVSDRGGVRAADMACAFVSAAAAVMLLFSSGTFSSVVTITNSTLLTSAAGWTSYIAMILFSVRIGLGWDRITSMFRRAGGRPGAAGSFGGMRHIGSIISAVIICIGLVATYSFGLPAQVSASSSGSSDFGQGQMPGSGSSGGTTDQYGSGSSDGTQQFGQMPGSGSSGSDGTTDQYGSGSSGSSDSSGASATATSLIITADTTDQYNSGSSGSSGSESSGGTTDQYGSGSSGGTQQFGQMPGNGSSNGYGSTTSSGTGRSPLQTLPIIGMWAAAGYLLSRKKKVPAYSRGFGGAQFGQFGSGGAQFGSEDDYYSFDAEREKDYSNYTGGRGSAAKSASPFGNVFGRKRKYHGSHYGRGFQDFEYSSEYNGPRYDRPADSGSGYGRASGYADGRGAGSPGPGQPIILSGDEFDVHEDADGFKYRKYTK